MPWQVSQVAPPAAIAATTVAFVESWHVAHVAWMPTRAAAWHPAWVQAGVETLETVTWVWWSAGPFAPWHTVQLVAGVAPGAWHGVQPTAKWIVATSLPPWQPTTVQAMAGA